MKTESPALDIPTVEAPADSVNELDELADRAVKIVFGSRIPNDDRYKLLGLKERLSTLQSEFSNDGCVEADQVLFDFRFIDQPALHTPCFRINDALRKLTGKESPRAQAKVDRRKTFVNQREKLLIRYFKGVLSRDETGALNHPELLDNQGNIRMTLRDVNRLLFGACPKRLSKDRFTAAFESLWRNEIARVVRRTGYHRRIRWVRVDWERFEKLPVHHAKESQLSDTKRTKAARRKLAPAEIERALSRIQSRALAVGEEPDQVLRIKRLRISDPLGHRWFDVQCWVHNRPNPWFFPQPADHEIRGQAFEPIIKTCFRIFSPTRDSRFQGPTYTNRTQALVKLISARAFCDRAGITDRQLRYEMAFINAKPLGVTLERVGRDLLAISLRPEDLYYVRDHLDTWKRQLPTEWVEPKVPHLENDSNSGTAKRMVLAKKKSAFDVNRADNATALSMPLNDEMPVASLPLADDFLHSSQIASADLASSHSGLEQLDPVPGPGCSNFKKEGAKLETTTNGIPADGQGSGLLAITESRKTEQSPITQIHSQAKHDRLTNDARFLARFYGDDDIDSDVGADGENDFRHQPWDGWLSPDCSEIIELLTKRLRSGECITNAIIQNVRTLRQLPAPWCLTPERLNRFFDVAEDSMSSIPFWLRVAPVEQLVTASTWKYAMRVTGYETLLCVDPDTKVRGLRHLAFADLNQATAQDIGFELVRLNFSAEELQLLGKNPRRLLLRLRSQAVQSFYCDPVSFDYEDLRTNDPEEFHMMEVTKVLVSYDFLQDLCRVPAQLPENEVCSQPSSQGETVVPASPAASQERVSIVPSMAQPCVVGEPARVPTEKPAEEFQAVLPSPPPLPEKWRSAPVPHAGCSGVPMQIRFTLLALHCKFHFSETPEILRGVEELASIPDPFFALCPERLLRYFELWESGKLPSSCKTQRINRLLHPHFWRRVVTYVGNYGHGENLPSYG